MSSQETTTANTAEMEETIARISSHKGVEGVMIMNRQGVSQCHFLSVDRNIDRV